MRKYAGLAVAVVTSVAIAPAMAIADQMTVDHGHGPTTVHDSSVAGITTQVHAWSTDGRTRIRLSVDGLAPGRTYGAHVHTGACGPAAGDSGGHYQSSTDSTVPLRDREVWLDVTGGPDGHAATTTTVPWVFAPGAASSVVIHAQPTDSVTGAAGARLACTTVELGR